MFRASGYLARKLSIWFRPFVLSVLIPLKSEVYAAVVLYAVKKLAICAAVVVDVITFPPSVVTLLKSVT